jgi:hypothetical protein
VAKKKISKRDAQEIMPVVEEFNSIAKQFINLLGFKVKNKERKVSLMVSRVKSPTSKTKHIDVLTVDVSTDFLKKKRREKKKGISGSGEWDPYFSSKKGTII